MNPTMSHHGPFPEESAIRRPKHNYLTKSSPSGGQCSGEDLNSFIAGQTRRIDEAGLDVFRLKPWIAYENSGWIISSRKHVEHMFDGQSMTSDDGLSTEDLRITGDSVNKLLVFHMLNMHYYLI
jgi:hypothetical protein